MTPQTIVRHGRDSSKSTAAETRRRRDTHHRAAFLNRCVRWRTATVQLGRRAPETEADVMTGSQNIMSDRRKTERADAAAIEDSVTYGSGNVFADLGFESSEEELLRANLALSIGQRIEGLGLSQARAGERMGVGQPDVSRIVRGRTEGFSLERRLGFLNRLGHDVDIMIFTPAGETEQPEQTRIRRVQAV